jgi:hypothetical protein
VRRLFLALGVLALLLTGCDREQGRPAETPPPAPPGAAASPSTPAGVDPIPVYSSGAPTPRLTTRSGPPFKAITVQGVVEVVHQCYDLRTDTDLWTLLGIEGMGLRAGERVEVTGVPAPEARGPCTGTPLRVQSVRPR